MGWKSLGLDGWVNVLGLG